MKKRILTIFFLALSFSSLIAQRKMIFEQVDCYSNIGPVMQYWNVPSIKQSLIGSISEELAKQGYAPLDTTVRVNILQRLNNDLKRNLPFSKADTATDHLYLELVESDPRYFNLFQIDNREDSSLLSRAKTFFRLNVLVLNGIKEKKMDVSILLFISEGHRSGIGIKVHNLFVTGKGFTEIIKAGFKGLIDPSNQSELIELQAPAAFYEDNFILPFVGNTPVYKTKQQKDFFSYSFSSEQQILRMGESFYEELVIKGKKSSIPESSTLSMNIQATGRSRSSDFVRLRQECRDVTGNNNYSIQLVVEVNPHLPYTSQADVFSYFLPGLNHVLLQDKDTLATFSIKRGEGRPEKKIFRNQITNGIDSSSSVTISGPETPRSVFYEFSMYGTLKGKKFSVHCTSNGLKEIMYNDSLAIVATGTSLPERFAVFDASLSSETINHLLILAFNRFFQQ